MTRRDNTRRTAYKLGALEFTVTGLGLFIGGPSLRARIDALDAAGLKQANAAAWQLRRKAERQLARVCNISVHGWTSYDLAALDYSVAEEVRKATWSRMASPATA